MLTFQRSDLPSRVLITGGMGFIGSHLAEKLLGMGHKVTVIDNLSTGRFENIQNLIGDPNFSFAVDDINNAVVLDRLVSNSDLVFHMAATVGVKLIVENSIHTVENNVLGTEAVMQSALRYRTKVLIASTSEVYGKSQKLPFTEDDDVVLGPTSRNRWAYAASKMIDEFLGLAYYHEKGLPVVVFRLFNTVGPRQIGQYGMVIPRFVQQGLRGEPLTVYGDGQQSRCFLHVHDAVEAIISLAENPKAMGQVFNVGSTDEITILDLAHRVMQLTDAGHGRVASHTGTNSLGRNGGTVKRENGRIVFVPYVDVYGTGFEDMRRRCPSITKVRDAIGFEPRHTMEKIIDDVIENLSNED